MSLSKESADACGIRVGQLKAVPARFKCYLPTCKLVLRDPVQGECGHRYCRAGIASTGPVECPACIVEGEESVPRLTLDSVQPDPAIARELQRTEFDCPWLPCKVKKRLPDLMHHAKLECKHRKVTCGLCGRSDLAASELGKHSQRECPKRLVKCPACRQEVPHDGLEEHKNAKCLGSTTECEHCGARVRDTPEARRSHALDACPVGWANGRDCPFGCGPMEDAMAHRQNNVNLHLDRQLAGLDSGAREVSELGATGTVELAAANEPSSAATQLEEVEASLAMTDLKHSLILYGLPHCPSQASDQRGQEAFFDHVRAAFGSGRELGRENDSMRQKLDVSYRQMAPLTEGMQRLYEELCKACDTYKDLLRAMSLKEVRICDLERSIALQELSSTDGTLVWKISFFKERLSAASEYEPIALSPFLFTNKFGYKLAAVAYLNGNGEGRNTHLSLYVRLLQGQFDSALQWPFKHKIVVTLMDQASTGHLVKEIRPDQSSQFQRPSQPLGQIFGFDRFAPKEDLEAKGFLKDDTLFVKIHVIKEGF